MRTNVEYLTDVFSGPGDYEGRLMHKPPRSGHKSLYDSGYKERWFKLIGNLLLYYRLNQHGGVCKDEASGMLVLEGAQVSSHSTCLTGEYFGLALTWQDGRSHLFYAPTAAARDTWLARLTLASYECQSSHLLQLRLQLRRRTGKDPLEHELGRPSLFPSTSCYPPSSSPHLMELTHSDVPHNKSRFYASPAWYGSSPCLSADVTYSVLHSTVSDPLTLEVGSFGGGPSARAELSSRRPSFKCHLPNESTPDHTPAAR